MCDEAGHRYLSDGLDRVFERVEKLADEDAELRGRVDRLERELDAIGDCLA